MRSNRILIEDMLAAIERIYVFTDGMTMEDFLHDEKTMWAVVKQYEIMGEAAKRLPTALTEGHPEVSWKSMARMRDRLAHGYFDVDFPLVWETLQVHLPKDIVSLRDLLREMHEE